MSLQESKGPHVSPYCPNCDALETTNHYLYHCPRYENERHHMLMEADNIHETNNTAKEDRDTDIVTLAGMRVGLPEGANNQMYLALSRYIEKKVVRSTAPGVDSPHKKAYYRWILQSNTFLITISRAKRVSPTPKIRSLYQTPVTIVCGNDEHARHSEAASTDDGESSYYNLYKLAMPQLHDDFQKCSLHSSEDQSSQPAPVGRAEELVERLQPTQREEFPEETCKSCQDETEDDCIEPDEDPSEELRENLAREAFCQDQDGDT
ncbi:hypothetical protein Bbelb_406390 [Branchiostoma belcheri]|nr:hypothetical protein Bbelb_406390 [Branchiostoma belcheri]